jgi:hypothetical protein
MHDPSLLSNSDTSVSLFALPGGGWRPLNLLLPPFELPPPAVDFAGLGLRASREEWVRMEM